MSDTPDLMTHERIMTGEEYVSYSDYLLIQKERDEARSEQSFIQCAFEDSQDKIEELERERDEAREKLENEMKWHHQTHKELVEAQCKLLDIEYDKLKS
jgi:septal ring factor EnvC (AmiA/AmiB activator)